MKLTAVVLTSVCASLALAGDDHGHEHEGGDYGLTIINGAVAVGIGDHDEGHIDDFGERVFGADMAISGTNWFADEPGIFIEEASLPDNTQVSFTVTQSLMYWDGTGAVSFSLSAEAMTLGFGPSSVSTSFDNSPVAGFSINYDADAVGGFDEHMDYTIDGSAASGIYLLANTFSLSGAADSDVIFTVFNAGLDEEIHDAALDYAENVLVPAPGAVGLIAVAGLGAMSRRRKA